MSTNELISIDNKIKDILHKIQLLQREDLQKLEFAKNKVRFLGDALDAEEIVNLNSLIALLGVKQNKITDNLKKLHEMRESCAQLLTQDNDSVLTKDRYIQKISVTIMRLQKWQHNYAKNNESAYKQIESLKVSGKATKEAKIELNIYEKDKKIFAKNVVILRSISEQAKLYPEYKELDVLRNKLVTRENELSTKFIEFESKHQEQLQELTSLRLKDLDDIKTRFSLSKEFPELLKLWQELEDIKSANDILDLKYEALGKKLDDIILTAFKFSNDIDSLN